MVRATRTRPENKTALQNVFFKDWPPECVLRACRLANTLPETKTLVSSLAIVQRHELTRSNNGCCGKTVQPWVLAGLTLFSFKQFFGLKTGLSTQICGFALTLLVSASDSSVFVGLVLVIA